MELFVFLTYLIFGSVALIALTEVVHWLREVWRRHRLTSEERELEDTWALGGSFSLRRPDSALRGRHAHKVLPNGRLTELNKEPEDPYGP